MLLELTIMKQVAEKKISVTCVSHFNKTLWEKFVQYSHKLLQGMFQEGGRKGEGGPKNNFIINWICMTADIIHSHLWRG